MTGFYVQAADRCILVIVEGLKISTIIEDVQQLLIKIFYPGIKSTARQQILAEKLSTTGTEKRHSFCITI